MARQMYPDGSIPREGLRDALSFTPDPDDWRAIASAPDNERIWLSGMGREDMEGWADPGSRTSDVGRTFSSETHSDVPEDQLTAWRPLDWMRLLSGYRHQLRAAEMSNTSRRVAADRAAAYEDLLGSPFSGGAYRQFSKARGLQEFAREMERIRRRNRGES